LELPYPDLSRFKYFQTMRNLVLIGGGNQAHYTIDIIEKEKKYNIVGIIDSVNEVGSNRFGYKILGRQENIQRNC
jgi:FlaA1/EpsC-like NDP-sugar epimerase